MKVLVIGGGAAGTAAAWRASQGAQVTVIHDRAGATELASGACDWQQWGERASDPLPAEVQSVLTDLGCWKVSPQGALLVNATGKPRWARAADAAVLDLAPLAGGRIAVSDLGRLGYDAKAWVATLSASRWARDTNTTFEALDCLPAPEAVRANDYDFAVLHDDEARVRNLGDALSSANTSAANRAFRAWLLPPALGLTQRARDKLEQRLAVKVGECLSQPGGPAGARFERARDALFLARSIAQLRGPVMGLAQTGTSWTARFMEGGHERSIDADRVVLACGGIVSGGLRLGQPRLDEPRAHPFELSLGLQVPLAFSAGPGFDQLGSLHGVDFSQMGLPLLEKIGVIANDTAIDGAPGLFAAGDIVASGPRSVLGALQSGCTAGQRAIAI